MAVSTALPTVSTTYGFLSLSFLHYHLNYIALPDSRSNCTVYTYNAVLLFTPNFNNQFNTVQPLDYKDQVFIVGSHPQTKVLG